MMVGWKGLTCRDEKLFSLGLFDIKKILTANSCFSGFCVCFRFGEK